MSAEWNIGVQGIMGYLPHRHPFLFLDRILEIDVKGSLEDISLASKKGTRVIAEKHFSPDEPFFEGHFPGEPIVPGVLLIETMAQASAFTLYPSILSMKLTGDKNPIRCILVGVDQARFRQPVRPGYTLRIETVLEKGRDTLCVFRCKGSVNGTLAVETQIMANLSISKENA